MAAVILQSSSERTGRGGGCGSSARQTKPEVVYFEKELSYELELLGKLSGRRNDHALRLKISNGLFQLWNKYETKLHSDLLADRQLSTGDTFYQAKEYQLALVHCYERYVRSIDTGCFVENINNDGCSFEWIVEFCKRATNIAEATFALRGAVGCTACRYYILQTCSNKQDPHFMLPQTVSTVQGILRDLQLCSQASLQREVHYWITHNCLLLLYTAARRLLRAGRASAVLDSLLWGSVCMESSIPLLTLRYLPFRVDLYMSVCRAYFLERRPQEAEQFARRGLDKIHELALLYHQSSSTPSETSEKTFHAATIKLGVVVFRRSVFESQLTKKQGFRPKKRPTIKELLQQSFPRSSTEKLLSELFLGKAARFLATVEALIEPSRRPLLKGPPRLVTSLDKDTTADVIQELLCAATDIALDSLQRWEKREEKEEDEGEEDENRSERETSPSLLDSAINKTDVVPLHSILHFLRMSMMYDQREVVELIGQSSLTAAAESSDPRVTRQLSVIRVLEEVDAVRLGGGGGVSGGGGRTINPTGDSTNLLIQDPGDRLVGLSSLLHSLCRDPSLVEWERDLLQDSVLFLWDHLSPVFSSLHSHHLSATRPFTSRKGKEYGGVLEQLVDMVEKLELWRPHSLTSGEMVLKLSALKESLSSHTNDGGEGGRQSLLLESLKHLERGMNWLNQYRSIERKEEEEREYGGTVGLIHSELWFALTRVQVKLAATLPPPATPQKTQKPSSLHHKVREAQEKTEKRQKLASSLPSHNTPVQSLSELKSTCRQNHYTTALLNMLDAALTPHLPLPKRTNLLQDALTELSILDNEQGCPRSPQPCPTPSLPPPPLLLHCSPTSMTFVPAPWVPPSNQEVCYYRLYGRLAEGSNVKVRLTDKNYPGLGSEVATGLQCQLKVTGLSPNTEYVFAVAAFGKNGAPLGQQPTGQISGLSSHKMGQLESQTSSGVIGHTGCPIVACHPLPLLLAWSYCSQCAYEAGVKSVALKAADKLWNHFVETPAATITGGNTPQYKLRSDVMDSAPPTLLLHFIYSVFIHTRLTSHSLLPLSSPPPPHPPHTSSLPPSAIIPSQQVVLQQWKRLELCEQLLLAVRVCGVIEDASLSLQAVVMVQGLLAPLLQRDIANSTIAKILLHCHSVLCEMPDSLLSSHSHISTQSALHHMIASSSFHLCKMLLKWKKTTLFSSVSESARALLLLTMPSTHLLSNPEIALDQSINSQAPSLSSYLTASSGFFSGLLIYHGTSRGQKKKGGGRKKVGHPADQIADEAKSREYKAFEAFTAAQFNLVPGHPVLDTSDITGQEDPTLLQAIVASIAAVQAHKEVYKFRRRPQYLQYFVLLATAGMEQGQHHLVLEWAHEAFTWLARRNEIILTTRPVHVSGKGVTTNTSRPRKVSVPPSLQPPSNSATGTTTTTKTTAPTTRAPSSAKTISDTHRGKPRPLSKATPTSSCSKALVKHSSGGGGEVGGTLVVSHGNKPGRRSRKGRSSMMNERLTRLLALEGVAVTRDDIVMKATSVLQTLLPIMWRNHRCRKRIREVSSDKLVWRAQSNLLLSQCHLNHILKSLSSPTTAHHHNPPPNSDFPLSGVILEGEIPTYPTVTPGYAGSIGVRMSEEDKEREQCGTDKLYTNSDSLLNHLAKLMRSLQRAAVLAQRGRLWIVLQNVCRTLLNTINTLTHCIAVSQLSQKDEEESGEGTLTKAAVYGLASRPLCMALDAITDLLSTSFSSSSSSSSSFSAGGAPNYDTVQAPDLTFLRTFSTLALQTMVAQEHWENCVSAGLRLCAIVQRDIREQRKEETGDSSRWRESWLREIVPVILDAQSCLAKRVAQHSTDLERKAIEPAAHFDPGPEGHNIYGHTGHALARACVPLDPQSVLHNLKIGQTPSDRAAADLLRKCKTLLKRYYLSNSMH